MKIVAPIASEKFNPGWCGKHQPGEAGKFRKERFMPQDFTTNGPLGVDAQEFERLLLDEEYYAVALITDVPVIQYDEDDEPLHGDGPCGRAGCPCMA
jgi:hypothetical protein